MKTLIILVILVLPIWPAQALEIRFTLNYNAFLIQFSKFF